MRLLMMVFLLSILVLSLACRLSPTPIDKAAGTPITVYVVRHAEKLDASLRDSPLSPEGEERAMALATTLARAGVDRIYATTFIRTQQTVAPLAAQLRLEPVLLEAHATDDLVQRIRSMRRGSVVLVAGHTNTVPGIVKGLSGLDVDGIPEERYDRLFKVMLFRDAASTVEELRYGVPTP